MCCNDVKLDASRFKEESVAAQYLSEIGTLKPFKWLVVATFVIGAVSLLFGLLAIFGATPGLKPYFSCFVSGVIVAPILGLIMWVLLCRSEFTIHQKYKKEVT